MVGHELVLTSVSQRHTAAASGLNSAVARTGGLVATALLGTVLAASGAELIAGFRTAAVVCDRVGGRGVVRLPPRRWKIDFHRMTGV